MEQKTIQPPITVKDEIFKLRKRCKDLEDRMASLEQKLEKNDATIQPTPHGSRYAPYSVPLPPVAKGPIDVNGILSQNKRI